MKRKKDGPTNLDGDADADDGAYYEAVQGEDNEENAHPGGHVKWRADGVPKLREQVHRAAPDHHAVRPVHAGHVIHHQTHAFNLTNTII